MTLSIVLALLGTIAGFAAVLVLVARYGGSRSDQLSLARSGNVRLKELERTASAGRDAASADAARVELLRELLDAARSGQSQWWPQWWPQWWLVSGDRGALVIIGLTALAIGCLSLLTVIDKAVPMARSAVVASAPTQDPDLARLERYANSKAPRDRATVPMSTPQGLPDVETMIERLAARLEAAPEDAEGWRMLGWSYFHVQQASKAAEAYARAVALRPQSPEFKSAYGEALVAVEAGTVTPKALEVFHAALALDAGHAKARYFVALAMEQAGKKKEALDAWLVLQAEPLADEAWVAELRERTQALARELKVDVSGRDPPPATTRAAADAPNGDAPHQPTAEEIRSIQALPADQRQALIREMVKGLADRLQKRPRDEEGWLRLIRSRMVLGEEQAAREALAQALAAFSDDVSAGARIAAYARELGITAK
jgi:cytochrome c-type biogenesis protein CcmH